MTDDRRVVVTNDDGIDASGIAALHDALSEIADVTVVAPADDRSGVGLTRSLSTPMPVSSHELGYAVEGTPSDCVAVALRELVPEADAVVSGINDGPNIGAHVLGRSGTVGAAMEAAFLGVPAVAASVYDPEYEPPVEYGYDDFALAGRVAVDAVAAFVAGDAFPGAEYVNVNAPVPREDSPPVRVTRPSRNYDLAAAPDEDGGVAVRDEFWEEFVDGDVTDAVGTDRRALTEGEVSVSPLTASHAVAAGDGRDVGDVLGPAGDSLGSGPDGQPTR